MSVPRVALIRSDDHHHRYVESLLRSRFDVRLVVVAPGPPATRRLRDRAYALYHRWRRIVTLKDRYRRRYFAHAPELWRRCAGEALRVPSVNDPAVVEALRAVRPDVTVTIGCSILRSQVLAAAGPRVVNVHGGLLPHYRGNHCVFFAVYDGRLDLVGSTIHHVDRGVDEGAIVDAVRPPLDGPPVPERLYCRAEKLAIHRLLGWLEALERGEPLPATPQPPIGRTYRVRDRGPVHDLRLWLWGRGWPRSRVDSAEGSS